MSESNPLKTDGVIWFIDGNFLFSKRSLSIKFFGGLDTVEVLNKD